MFYNFGKTYAEKQREREAYDADQEHRLRLAAEAEVQRLKELLNACYGSIRRPRR